jgi:N-methylhydantoinase A
MEKAIRVVSIERGYDPREFVLVAFGGAGALHACELAAALSIPRVLVPARPGALSAFGILVSDVVKDYSRTVLWRTLNELPLTRLNAEFNKLRRKAGQDFLTENWKGAIQCRLSVDVRYRGQGYELNIPYTDRLLTAFRREHDHRYGYSYPAREIELVTLRLRAIMKSPQSTLGKAGAARCDGGNLDPVRTSVFFENKKIASAIYDRESLQPGKKHSGAAIVTEYSATTIVPPRAKFWLDRNRNLFIQLRP